MHVVYIERSCCAHSPLFNFAQTVKTETGRVKQIGYIRMQRLLIINNNRWCNEIYVQALLSPDHIKCKRNRALFRFKPTPLGQNTLYVPNCVIFDKC